MVPKFKRIFESIPIIFPVLINDFGVSMHIEFPFILAETNVVDVNEVVDNFLPVFPAERLNFV